MPFVKLLTFAILMMLGMPASAQTPPQPGLMAATSLIAETATVRPGQKFWVAVRQRIAPGWHTYWINPGDAGEPLNLEWRLPEGFTAGEIQWPLPEAIPVLGLTNYGYSGEVFYLVQLSAPDAIPPGGAVIGARARWLACEKICIPEEAELKLSLAPAPEAGVSFHSAEAQAIAAWAERLPKASPWPAVARAEAETAVLTVKGAAAGASGARFFPLDWGLVDNSAEQRFSANGGDISLELRRGDLRNKPLGALKGLLVIDGQGPEGPTRTGYWIEAKAGDAAAAPSPEAPVHAGGGQSAGEAGPGGSAAAGAPGLTSPGLTLWSALAFALIGGAILNLMPCVFPVLSLKAFSLAAQPAHEGRRHGLAYVAGVMASFAALGALLIALRAGGAAFGWGFQFQSPEFVLGMAALFFALGLSLSGVFTLGGSLMGMGDGLTRGGGARASFFTGVLAAVASTPCTAPFMGAALGYAMTQPPAITFATVMALGAGFALPMAALSFSAAARRVLPRPGAWMAGVKQFMAFPLYMTTAWLIWVLSVQKGSDGVLAAAVALIGVAFAAWLFGRAQHAGGVLRPALAAVLATLALGGAARALSEAPAAPLAAASESGPLRAQAYSADALSRLRAEGRPVFVNFTAAWCISCKANERLALSSERIARAFAENGVVYMKADWTNYDPEITRALQGFGRAGVPVYAFYPAGGAAPVLLPELLTEATVIEAVARPSQPQPQGDLTRVQN